MKINIYQINMGRDTKRLAFMGTESLEKFSGSSEIDSSIYDCVFKGEVDCRNLEDVYYSFNNIRPEGYMGRSLSVSDIVEVTESEITDPGFYFCDTVGFASVKFEPEKARPFVPKKTMTVVLVEPGKLARTAEIGTELADMQRVVGGDIEPFYPYEDDEVALVCNDEGKINGKALNRAVYDKDGQMIEIMAGTFFICDCSGERFAGLSQKQQERYIKMFKYPENFIKLNGNIVAIKFDPNRNRGEAR